MQSIPFHIAYLLTQHECVIVPGLGAFVVSSSKQEEANRWGILSPPETSLGFNSQITRNDGLLSNSLAKERNISDEEANLLIEQYVTDVLQAMEEGKQVHIPWVGGLYLKDNKKLFQPERTLSCNAFNYGLTNISMPYLKDIQNIQNIQQKTNSFPKKKDKRIVWIPVNRKFITYSGSIVAALVAMCLIPTPLNNGHRTQYASVVILPVDNTVNEEKASSEIETPAPADSALTQEKTETPPSEVMPPVKAVEFHYYIIVDSLPDRNSAERILPVFQSKGFENAAILSSGGKHLIYANRFEDKIEAEKALIQFRKDYPANANAWLLKN